LGWDGSLTIPSIKKTLVGNFYYVDNFVINKFINDYTLKKKKKEEEYSIKIVDHSN
jgi:hypothetical protein